MSGHLKFWIRNYGDGTGELFAEVESHGFAGVGHACFDLTDLVAKAEKFARYPLSTEEPVCISGGYWTDDLKQIEQEHVHISALPINLLGEISLLVRVAESHDGYPRTGIRHSVSVELKASYEQMSQLSKDLSLLARGEIAEVIFNEPA
ncbi:MAG: hypothetical protein V4568_20225 [Pseudomonadota bacterium]